MSNKLFLDSDVNAKLKTWKVPKSCAQAQPDISVPRHIGSPTFGAIPSFGIYRTPKFRRLGYAICCRLGDKLPPPLNDAGMVFLSETIKGAVVAMPS